MGLQSVRLFAIITWLIVDLGSVIHYNGVEGVDLMFQLYAGREDCFYEYAERNKTMYLEYTVIGTGMGDSEVNFQLIDPSGRPVVTEFRKASSTHELTVPADGQYKLCFDNTYSHFTAKTVAFAITTTSPGETNWNEYPAVMHYAEGAYDLQVNEIKDRLDKVRTAVNEMQTHQEQFRKIELRDRSVAEHNFERVNHWSTVFLIFSLTIGGIQVFMLKGLFDPHYDVRKYVKKLVR